MKTYKFEYILYDPAESTEPDKYMAEIPALPGCCVWGDTPEDTLEILQDMTASIIETYIERGYELPASVENAMVVPENANDLMVSV